MALYNNHVTLIPQTMARTPKGTRNQQGLTTHLYPEDKASQVHPNPSLLLFAPTIGQVILSALYDSFFDVGIVFLPFPVGDI